MAEAPQQEQQQQQEEEEEQQLPSSVETTEPDEGSEEPNQVIKTARPLLSMRSMSTIDPDDDYPNMTVYRKVGQQTHKAIKMFWSFKLVISHDWFLLLFFALQHLVKCCQSFKSCL